MAPGPYFGHPWYHLQLLNSQDVFSVVQSNFGGCSKTAAKLGFFPPNTVYFRHNIPASLYPRIRLYEDNVFVFEHACSAGSLSCECRQPGNSRPNMRKKSNKVIRLRTLERSDTRAASVHKLAHSQGYGKKHDISKTCSLVIR